MGMERLEEFVAARIGAQPNGLRSAVVARLIEDAVQQGLLLPGEMLPAERNLCLLFDVSRTTLRRALALLEEAGTVNRRPGSGTFVSPRVMAPKAPLAGFTQDTQSRGMQPRSLVLLSRRGQVQPEESFNLGLAPGTRVFRLERLRFADDLPVSLEASVVPIDSVPDTYEGATSLYSAMDSLDSKPVKIVQRYGASLATTEQAHHLGVSVGAALLVLQRIGFCTRGRAVEFTRSHFRGDRFFISTELDV